MVDKAVPEPPLAGVPLLLSLIPLTLMGVVLGVITAFLVPVGTRLGAGALPPQTDNGPAATPGGTQSLAHLATAVDGGSGGVPLSLGVGLAFVGCLGLAAVARVSTGERIAALAPVTGWVVIALLANMSVRGDLLLPAGLEPGVLFLYAGVLGGCLGLLPRGLIRRFRPPPSGTTTAQS